MNYLSCLTLIIVNCMIFLNGASESANIQKNPEINNKTFQNNLTDPKSLNNPSMNHKNDTIKYIGTNSTKLNTNAPIVNTNATKANTNSTIVNKNNNKNTNITKANTNNTKANSNSASSEMKEKANRDLKIQPTPADPSSDKDINNNKPSKQPNDTQINNDQKPSGNNKQLKQTKEDSKLASPPTDVKQVIHQPSTNEIDYSSEFNLTIQMENSYNKTEYNYVDENAKTIKDAEQVNNKKSPEDAKDDEEYLEWQDKVADFDAAEMLTVKIKDKRYVNRIFIIIN